MSQADYDLKDELGRGNFGVVYEAVHKVLKRRCAIKLLRVPLGGERDSLLEEARSQSKMDSVDHVVRVFHAGDWDDQNVFLDLEFCDGGSLAKFDQDAISIDEACALVSDSCRGLIDMHERGLLHRDIRPANILLLDGVPKLTDFGLAQWTYDSHASEIYQRHAAPEAIRDEPMTVLSDQYSMAMTLAHLVTGGAVCDKVSPSVNGKAGWAKWPPVETLSPHTPSQVLKVIRCATSWDPDDRYVSMSEFKTALDNATPKISLARKGPSKYATPDGVWVLLVDGIDERSVVVRKRGKKGLRRVNKYCSDGLDGQQADKAVANFANLLGAGNA